MLGKRDFSGDGSRNWCPICSDPIGSDRKLANHMKDVHHRLIRDKDINRAAMERHARFRAMEVAEEALLAV